jgi:predicted Zn-dependent peptidase
MAPAQGRTVEENQKALDALIDRFKAEKVDGQTLARVKAQARIEVLRRLDSNAELASLLTSYYANFGDWRKLFTTLDDYNKVTAEDVQRVARTYFVPQSRTVAYIAKPSESGQKPAGGAR